MNPPRAAPPSSPRPPPVGKETRTFRDIYAQPGHVEEPIDSCVVKPARAAMAHAARESSPPSPAPALRWAQGLPSLLEDYQGSSLFREFLEQEGHETRSLDFWFGLKGLKKPDVTHHMTQKAIPALYSKMVQRIPLISQATKDEILRKISSGGVLGVDIFDAAQGEVEDYMRRTTYPNFLKSDLYIQQLQGVCPPPMEEVGGDLPTLHEDRELNVSVRKIEFRSLFRNQKKNSRAKSKLEAQAAFLKSPSAPYHTTYAPFLPASARDSEVQSFSSGMQTDDAMSQSNSSMSDHNVYRKQKYQQKPVFKYLNKDFDTEESTFIPRTSQPLPEAAMIHSRPEKFVSLLTEKLKEAQREMEFKETVNKKLESIEPSAVKSFPRQPVPFIPEDNDQSILDDHISMVFPEKTPNLLSPAPCATPPLKDPHPHSRMMLQAWGHEQQEAAAARVSPFAAPFAGRMVKRESDTRSNDSGALTDWISEDNLRLGHSEPGPSYEARRAREKLQRSKKLSILAGSSTSFFDSGVSMACESVQMVHTKVTNSLEPRRCSSEAENDRRGKNSPDLARSSRKAAASYAYPSRVPDPSQWPAGQELPSHDTMASLKETRRILEDEMRNKPAKSKYVSTGRSSHEATRGKVSSRACDTAEDGLSHRKQSKKSTGNPSGSGESTIVGYSYGLGSTPFKSKLEGKNPTLKQFKTLIKKGNFRYFFKSLSDDFGTTLVYDEVTDDHAPLPLWEGKVFCVIEAQDDPSSAWSSSQEAASQEIKL